MEVLPTLSTILVFDNLLDGRDDKRAGEVSTAQRGAKQRGQRGWDQNAPSPTTTIVAESFIANAKGGGSRAYTSLNRRREKKLSVGRKRGTVEGE